MNSGRQSCQNVSGCLVLLGSEAFGIQSQITPTRRVAPTKALSLRNGTFQLLSSIMSSTMAIDKPKAPKLDIDEYLTLAISGTPAELHPFFESFRNLYSRKCVTAP